MTRRILVTSALPYANGPLHLGHIIEALQTDVWVRFQKLLGHEALYHPEGVGELSARTSPNAKGAMVAR